MSYRATRLPTLNQRRTPGLLLSKHQDGKVDQIQGQVPYNWSPCHPACPSSIYLLYCHRLSLKTKWLCHSQGSDFCRFDNINIKLKYECYLFTSNNLLCHEQYIMPLHSVLAMPGASLIIGSKRAQSSPALEKPLLLWLGWAPSLGASDQGELS